jgi:steroid delta-isomerase-like uncharacterized protein
MHVDEMKRLIDRHLKAEGAGDIEAAIAVYTDDVEHDAVGFPGSPRTGKEAARAFYEILAANFREDHETVVHEYVAGDALIMEQLMTGTVIGSMLGLPGNGRQVTFRMLHVFEFKDGLISRENVWLDTASIVRQLSGSSEH